MACVIVSPATCWPAPWELTTGNNTHWARSAARQRRTRVRKRGRGPGKLGAQSNKRVVLAIITPENFALLDPPVPSLEPLLSYYEFEFESDGPYGHRRVEREVSMAVFDHRGRLAFPAGLLPRCRAELEAHGYAVTVKDHRKFGRRFQLNEALLEEVAGDERSFLEAVASAPLGQVEVRGFADSVRKIALMCELFAKARVVVAVATRRQRWRYWRALEEALGEPAGLLWAGHRRGGVRCLVVTHPYLTAARKADILVLADAGQAARPLVPTATATPTSTTTRSGHSVGAWAGRSAAAPTAPAGKPSAPSPRGRAAATGPLFSRALRTAWCSGLSC
jgi:hypothetical protein